MLVSEVMLQQTQVARVAVAFPPFLAEFPSPQVMAAGGADRVVAAWSRHRLGYLIRARRLHAAAVVVTRDGWPDTADGLRRLPGVGPYTAAAVAAIAFGEPVAAVDTNLRRVVSRWMGRPLTGRDLSATATALMGGDAGVWNQAMMDLGALVCRPRPRCHECPVAAQCADPTVYLAPPRQTRFEGSDRQVAAAVVRVLSSRRRRVRPDAIAALGGLDPVRVERALTRLVADGLVEAGPAGYRLAR